MRYWRLISIVVVIVVVISTFYIQSAVATHKYPSFALEKQRGDEKEVEGVTLQGEYVKGDLYRNLQISVEGSKDLSERSFFERLVEESDSPYIRKLKKDYKNFMRGKDMEESMFYEDKTLLAYVDLGLFDEFDDAYTFNIDILEKETKDRQSFQVTQQDDKYSYVYVEDVLIRDDQVIVFTRNHVRESGNTEIHAYWFNIADEKLTHEEIILSIDEEDEQNSSNVALITSNDKKDSNHYIVFQVDHYFAPDDEQMDSELKETELLAYDLETKKLEKIKLPEEIDGITNIVVLNQSKLYFANETEHTFEIFTYDVENKKKQDKQTMDIPNVVDPTEGLGLMWNIDNNKIYISGDLKKDKSFSDFMIVDLDSGDTLYEGTIEAKMKQSLPDMDELIITGISIE